MQRAHAAASRREWAAAHELFAEAAKAGVLPPRDRPLVAEVAYAAGHLDATIETWEQVHAESVRAGDNLAGAGAAVRVAMHLLFDTALMAPVRGWLSRAERLLGASAGTGDTPVHAWLAVVRNYERMLSGDPEGARKWARRAIEVGGRHDPAAAAIGRIAEARGLILVGEVKEGLALLEEAGVATVSGELDPLSTGVVYCELVCALQGLAQYDLAEEWTTAMERWCARSAIGSLHGRCRVHRAEILRLHGSFAAAEDELRLACNELRPYVRRELGWPLCELGRIKLRKGDLEGAEEVLLEAHDIGWDAQPGLALVHLARGDVALAAASIRDAIEHPSYVPSKELPPNTDLRRAPLLEAQVEIGIAAGDVGRARSASEELTRVAKRFESKALVASASASRGRVLLAEGNAPEAERTFEEASRLWHDLGAPYEAAMARTGLAEAHRASGHEATADLELRSARATLERLGLARGPGSARASDRPIQLTTLAGADAAAEGNELRHEGDTWAVTFDGCTVRIRDRKGVRYIARMLAEPEREFHVLDLVAAETGVAVDADAAALGDAGPLLDAKAKAAYRRRVSEIEEDIAEAERLGDIGRGAAAQCERELLVRELSRAFGRGGRDRPAAGSAGERARASVTRAVRQAILRIAEYHPSLGAHLERVIKTGAFCAYAPDPQARIVWNVSRHRPGAPPR
jgi:tetratricopeptide (TPR) repeat protein